MHSKQQIANSVGRGASETRKICFNGTAFFAETCLIDARSYRLPIRGFKILNIYRYAVRMYGRFGLVCSQLTGVRCQFVFQAGEKCRCFSDMRKGLRVKAGLAKEFLEMLDSSQ